MNPSQPPPSPSIDPQGQPPHKSPSSPIPPVPAGPWELPQEKPSWHLGDFFLFFLVQHIFSFLLYGILTSFVSDTDTTMRRYFTVLATLLSNVFILGVYVIRARWHKRFAWTDIGWRLTSQQNVVYWAVVFFVLVFGFNSIYQTLLKWFELGIPKQEIASFFGANQPLSLKAITLFLVVVMAPLTEEVLYRGVLFPALEPHLHPHHAAMAAGMLFGAIHFEPHTILPLAFLGYLLCLTYHYTRSLWLCIALHAVNNTLAFVVLIWFS